MEEKIAISNDHPFNASADFSAKTLQRIQTKYEMYPEKPLNFKDIDRPDEHSSESNNDSIFFPIHREGISMINKKAFLK